VCVHCVAQKEMQLEMEMQHVSRPMSGAGTKVKVVAAELAASALRCAVRKRCSWEWALRYARVVMDAECVRTVETHSAFESTVIARL
jgi:hypothetical protein